jgi:hypothetical protein
MALLVDHIPGRWLSGKKQDLAGGILCFHLDRQIDPREAGHLNIRYQQIGRFHSGGGQRFYWRGESMSGVSVKLQDCGERGCDDGFIVNNENAWRNHIFPLSSILLAVEINANPGGGRRRHPECFPWAAIPGGAVKGVCASHLTEEWSIRLTGTHLGAQKAASDSPGRRRPGVSKIDQTVAQV